MYNTTKILRLRLVPNFVVRLVANKNYYLRLTVGKMPAFEVFNDLYFQPYGCSDTNFTATVKNTNPKTEIQSEIIEI